MFDLALRCRGVCAKRPILVWMLDTSTATPISIEAFFRPWRDSFAYKIVFPSVKTLGYYRRMGESVHANGTRSPEQGTDFNEPLALTLPGQCSQVATAMRAGPMVDKRLGRNVVRQSLRQFYPPAVRDIPNRAPVCHRRDCLRIRTPPALPGNSPSAGRGNLPCAHHGRRSVGWSSAWLGSDWPAPMRHRNDNKSQHHESRVSVNR